MRTGTGRLGMLALFVLWLSGCAHGMKGEVYDTAGNPKAKGLHVQVNYPEDWEREEIGKKNILVQFARVDEKQEAVGLLLLQIYAFDGEDAKQLFPVEDAWPQDRRHGLWREAMGDNTANMDVISISDGTATGGLPAILIELRTLQDASEDGFFACMKRQDIYTRLKMLHVYENGRVVALSCAAGARMANRETAERLMEKNADSVCQPYFDSLRFVGAAEE